MAMLIVICRIISALTQFSPFEQFKRNSLKMPRKKKSLTVPCRQSSCSIEFSGPDYYKPEGVDVYHEFLEMLRKSNITSADLCDDDHHEVFRVDKLDIEYIPESNLLAVTVQEKQCGWLTPDLNKPSSVEKDYQPSSLQVNEEAWREFAERMGGYEHAGYHSKAPSIVFVHKWYNY